MVRTEQHAYVASYKRPVYRTYSLLERYSSGSYILSSRLHTHHKKKTVTDKYVAVCLLVICITLVCALDKQACSQKY